VPIGVQAVAGPWREDIVIAALQVIEKELGGYQKPSI
jgi:amidase